MKCIANDKICTYVKDGKVVTENPCEYIGLSLELKPVENVSNGSTFLEVDTKRLYIFYEGGWYNQTDDYKQPEE